MAEPLTDDEKRLRAASLLNADESYRAALHDYKIAESRAGERARKFGRSARPEHSYANLLREELEKLWQGRIDRGELPPLLPEPLDRATEAA